MKAITVEPKRPGSARYEDAPEPDERDGSALVEPFDVIAIYSFEGDKCSRVEFIR